MIDFKPVQPAKKLLKNSNFSHLSSHRNWKGSNERLRFHSLIKLPLREVNGNLAIFQPAGLLFEISQSQLRNANYDTLLSAQLISLEPRLLLKACHKIRGNAFLSKYRVTHKKHKLNMEIQKLKSLLEEEV